MLSLTWMIDSTTMTLFPFFLLNEFITYSSESELKDMANQYSSTLIFPIFQFVYWVKRYVRWLDLILWFHRRFGKIKWLRGWRQNNTYCKEYANWRPLYTFKRFDSCKPVKHVLCCCLQKNKTPA